MRYIRKCDRATAWQLANKRLKEIDELPYEERPSGERLAICMLMHVTWFPGVDKY